LLRAGRAGHQHGHKYGSYTERHLTHRVPPLTSSAMLHADVLQAYEAGDLAVNPPNA
jgi:hypothetical protein